jgi:hypothetical protein
VDLGPVGDATEEVAAFTAFWGEKSELRRFRDGALRQACVWTTDEATRHHTVAHIAKHILQRTAAPAPHPHSLLLCGVKPLTARLSLACFPGHLQVDPATVSFVGDQFDSLLRLHKAVPLVCLFVRLKPSPPLSCCLCHHQPLPST